MAAKSSDPLKKLEEELTCSICLDQLTNPKTLSCLHSFCQACLERLTDYNNEVKCPTCRSTFDLGEEGVDSLQTAFLVNNLLEVHDMLKKVGSDKMVLCDVCSESFAVGYCQQCESFSCDQCIGFHNKWKKNVTHSILTLEELADSAYNIPRVKSEAVMKCTGHNKPLDIYCETCDELICQHCTVRIHRDHEYDVVNDIYNSQRGQIENSIEPIDKLIDKATEQMKSLNTSKMALAVKGEKVKQDIEESVSNIMDTLFEAGNKLSREVDTAIDEEETSIGEELDKIEESLSKLTSCKKYVEQCLSVGSPQQVLSSKLKLIEHVQSVVDGCGIGDCRQRRDFAIQLVNGDKLKKSAILKSIGVVHCERVTTPKDRSFEDDEISIEPMEQVNDVLVDESMTQLRYSVAPDGIDSFFNTLIARHKNVVEVCEADKGQDEVLLDIEADEGQYDVNELSMPRYYSTESGEKQQSDVTVSSSIRSMCDDLLSNTELEDNVMVREVERETKPRLIKPKRVKRPLWRKKN